MNDIDLDTISGREAVAALWTRVPPRTSRVGATPGRGGVGGLRGGPADAGSLVLSQQMDAEVIAALLDRIGPAVVITHSASGPVGWLVADRRPTLVQAIVAVEPMGPQFASIPMSGP